jgi:large subunit ribosomal protein L6
MKQELTETMDIPQGVTVRLEHGVFHVKGPKGEASKLLHNPRVDAKVEGSHIKFHVPLASLREKKLVMTFAAHLRQLFKGVQHGHSYKLKICSSHFPMTVAVKAGQLEVKNFFGEQVPRYVKIPAGVNVKVDGTVVSVDGVSKEAAGQFAAEVEKSTKRPNFDKRSFQDGLFIIEKDGKSMKD